MKKNLQYMQWLVFWLSAYLPFAATAAAATAAAATAAAATAAAATAAAATAAAATAAAPLPPAQDFLFTEPEFETLRDADAIDNQTITAIAQDTRGLLWFGTQNGLVRYDGYQFRKFIHKASDPFSLAGDYVFSLFVASDGRVWVGTVNDGVSVFDPASERFAHFPHDEKLPDSLGGGRISALQEDARGGMWIATTQGLDYLPAGSKRFVHFRHGTDPHSLLNDKVRSLLRDKAGRLWVGSNNGLQRLSTDGKNFETVVTGKNVVALFQAVDGKLWLGTDDHGAAWLMPDRTRLGDTPLDSPLTQQVNWLPLAQLSHPWITGIAQVKTGQIWLASYGGGIIIVAASDGHVLQTLRHDPVLPRSLALNQIKPLLSDSAGWLWVGTWGAGLQRMNGNNTMLRLLRHSSKRPNGLSHPDVRSLLELANGQLLIGSKGNGIDIFDRRQGLVGGYRLGQGQPGMLPDANISSLAQTHDGSIWAGTQQAGIVRQLVGTKDWVVVPGVPSKSIRKLLVVRDGSLWVGTIRGVARWRPSEPPPVRFEQLTDEQGKPLEFTVNAMAEGRQGQVWIGTDNGLWLYQPGHKGLISVPTEPNRPDGLVSGYVSSLLFDSHERLWIETDKGIERLKSLNDKLARFEHVNALLGKTGKTLEGNLLEDRQGRIWMEDGMIDPAPAKMRMNRFTLADGMDLGSTWIGSYTQTRDGLMLFGGTKGVAIIDPSRFETYEYAPQLVITELKINGEVVQPRWLTNRTTQTRAGADTAASLTLTPAQRNFAFEFAALDYSEPKKNRYQYRLQGYDKNWINTDAAHRSATYGNLWPGLYTLQVRGSNRAGDWSRHELSIPIRVLPAWWQTWWFGLVLLLAISSLIAALVQTRTRYLRQRQRVLEQQVKEATHELRQKQVELLDANHELNQSNKALNQSNEALGESNLALNDANTGLALSVETLRQLGDIGREITANLDADIVFQSLYLYVGGLLNAPTMTIYRINVAATALDAVFGRDDDQVMPTRSIALNSPTSNAARVVRERQELLLHIDPLADSPNHVSGTRKMLTALFAPLIVDDRVLGVMSIQSDKQNAYGERECLIFRTLSAYGAIALANASAIAALNKAQGQLVQQEKMASLGGLVAGIAHEINTPLGTTLVAISGVESAWQTLQDAIASGRLSKAVLESSTTEGMEYTTLALKTATRAAELIALFKTISVNAASDRPVDVELATYLPEVATLVRNQLTQNGCKLELATTPGLSVHVVPDALTETLSRVLVNVLNHAFADGRTGTLHLNAQAVEDDEGDEVAITVRDDGHGIAPEDLPKVFDPFFTTKSGIHGHVGLGLHVAYNHVTQRLKGKIHITSTLGEGTCVKIRLKKTEPRGEASQ